MKYTIKSIESKDKLLYYKPIYEQLMSEVKSSKQKINDEAFINSIDEFVKWHKSLESRMFPGENKIPLRQETKALLFTSEINIEHIYFLKKIYSVKQLKTILPVFIFNYLVNHTDAEFLTLLRISKNKSQIDPWNCIRNLFFKVKTPTYLLMPKDAHKSMNKIYTERLIKNIKCSFIHVVSFLRILNLQICKDSDKINCLKWYYHEFKNNAEMFFNHTELDMIIDGTIQIDNLNEIIGYIETIDINNDLQRIYIERIEEYIKKIMENKNENCKSGDLIKNIDDFEIETEDFINISLCPDSFSKRFDYFYGKYLCSILYSTCKQYDLFKVIIDTNDVTTDKLSVYYHYEEKDEKILCSLKHVHFAINDIQRMETVEVLLQNHVHYPSFVLNGGFEYTFPYRIDGSISNIKGSLMIGNDEVKCCLSKIDCKKNDYSIIIDGFDYNLFNIRDYLKKRNNSSSDWVLYILTYYIVYTGNREKLFRIVEKNNDGC